MIRPSRLPPLAATDPLGDATVLDFWQWALGDLRMNNARGYLAEYFVARALEDERAVRVEWGPYDVLAKDGTLVEVKATGRLQSWSHKTLSTPSWSFKAVRATTVWSEELGEEIPVDPRSRVHVWVFALQTATDPAAYDPRDLSQWEFRVVPHRQLLDAGQTSARLSFFDRLQISPVSYGDLPAAVATARARNATL